MIQTQFKLRNAENQVFKAMLYISPDVVPNTGSGNIVVGNSVREAIGGSNIDPIVSLYPSTYNIRVVGSNFETIFTIDISSAPTGSVVNATDYITT